MHSFLGFVVFPHPTLGNYKSKFVVYLVIYIRDAVEDKEGKQKIRDREKGKDKGRKNLLTPQHQHCEHPLTHCY